MGRSSVVWIPTSFARGCACSSHRQEPARRRYPPRRSTRDDVDGWHVKLGSMWPFRHGGLKIISVALAVVLWMAVSGEEVIDRGLRVPLELQQFPPGLELAGEPPGLVDVRVRGGSSMLSRV